MLPAQGVSHCNAQAGSHPRSSRVGLRGGQRRLAGLIVQRRPRAVLVPRRSDLPLPRRWTWPGPGRAWSPPPHPPR